MLVHNLEITTVVEYLLSHHRILVGTGVMQRRCSFSILSVDINSSLDKVNGSIDIRVGNCNMQEVFAIIIPDVYVIEFIKRGQSSMPISPHSLKKINHPYHSQLWLWFSNQSSGQ